MAKFTVLVQEVWVRHVLVEAETAMLALEKVSESSEKTDEYLEYSHEKIPDTWTVEDEEGNIIL